MKKIKTSVREYRTSVSQQVSVYDDDEEVLRFTATEVSGKGYTTQLWMPVYTLDLTLEDAESLISRMNNALNLLVA